MSKSMSNLANEIQREITGANEELTLSKEREELSGEAMDSMERTYWEGYTEALQWVKAQLEKKAKLESESYNEGIRDALSELSEVFEGITDTDLWAQYMTEGEGN